MDNRKTINRYLGNRGLSTLEDPQGLVMQLGFLVEGHDHFQQLINKCEPQHRRDMYEALRPHLRFEAKPLDVYIAELGMQAEIEQLPTVDSDGMFHAFRPAQIWSAEARQDLEKQVGDLVEAEGSKHHLELTCKKCTRTETFHGGLKAEAIHKARLAGWTYGLDHEGKGREICPECPAGKN